MLAEELRRNSWTDWGRMEKQEQHGITKEAGIARARDHGAKKKDHLWGA